MKRTTPQRSMRVTIKDVAREASVSPATVSLVLNNAPGVSAITREKVVGVMRDINYKPDALARNFSSRRAQAIALVIPPTPESLDDPFYTRLLRGVLEATRDHGYQLLLEIADERFTRQRLWDDLFHRRRVDGLMVATPRLDEAYLGELAASDCPVLLVEGARPDLPRLDYAGYDDFRAGVDATYYLLGLGHRRVAHLGGPKNEASAVARRKGYEQALVRARIPLCESHLLTGDYNALWVRQEFLTLLARPEEERPTAVFCANDTIAIAVIATARQAGLRVPEDLSVIGVDDTGAAEKSDPPLTTLRQDVYALANAAAVRFLNKLDERGNERIFESPPMPLIERNTCAPPPSNSATGVKS